jgi:hypothetical protein
MQGDQEMRVHISLLESDKRLDQPKTNPGKKRFVQQLDYEAILEPIVREDRVDQQEMQMYPHQAEMPVTNTDPVCHQDESSLM